jgi:tight adherence protein C
MFLLLLIGIVLTAAAVALVARAVLLPRLRAEAGLEQIGAYGFPAPERGADATGRLTEALDRLAERLGAAMLPRFSGSKEAAEVRTLLMSAGIYGITPGKFLGYRGLSAIGLTVLWMWMGPAAGFPIPLFVLVIPVMAIVGWTIPLSLLRVRAKRRLDEIDFELPELVDSLVVTVEAGIGFSGALRLAARELTGPLGEEIQLTLQEQNMGLSNDAALNNLVKRVNLPSMHSFARSVIQGDTLGVSIGEIMRGLAVEMRSRRRAKAEERAQKAPVKMLFPLVFCIFPAIMIILMYPAVTEFKAAFGG